MRNDFTPDNIELWIDNWKRKEVINIVARSWIDSFPFQKINFVVNHSSVSIDDFDKDLRPKIKIWDNCLRHDSSRGPITKNINQAYVQTFLSGKKYCMYAHDSYYARKGWDNCIKNTDYLFYSAPQGDGFHIITLEGLRRYGWWDERYATMGWHEIDYLARIIRKDLIEKTNKSSIVDIHELWPKEFDFVTNNHTLFYNSCGLEDHIIRFSKKSVRQIGPKSKSKFDKSSDQWHNKKWKNGFSRKATILSINEGPLEDEVNWYPWLDLKNLETDRSAY